MRVSTAITIVGSVRAHLVKSASLVLVVRGVVVATPIGTPSSIAIHRLCAASCGALHVVVTVWAAITAMSRVFADLVLSASLILMSATVVVAISVTAPASNTVDRLAATTCSTLQVVVGVGASITTVSSACAVLIASAPLILVSYAVVVA